MGYAAPTGDLFSSLSTLDKIIVSGKVGAVLGAGSGITSGYAGGVGSIEDMLRGGAIGLATGAVSGAALQAIAPPLSELAAKVGGKLSFQGITLKSIYDAIDTILKFHPSMPSLLNAFTTNVGTILDANRVLLLGGGAALGTGAALNEQILPLLKEHCNEGSGSECAASGNF